MEMTIIERPHQVTASPGSDALALPSSVGQVPIQQSGRILRKKDDIRVAYWNVRTLQDVGMQALTMRELWKYNMDISWIPEVRIPDSGHSVIKVPGEEACYHLYHSGVMDNTGWLSTSLLA